MQKTVRRWYVILSVLLCAALMSVVDGIIQPGYAVKSAVKIVLFLLLPLLFFLTGGEGKARLKALILPGKRGVGVAIGLGAAVYAVILGGYLLLRDAVDFSSIAQQLTADAGVSGENFLFVALYISFVNSLLEEFFFRGYAFLTLKELTGRTFAYGFSAAVFALYHLGMTAGWFSPALWLLAMAGLFAGGCIFARLNEKNGSMLTSWLVHMCANFAINTVGFILFGIL